MPYDVRLADTMDALEGYRGSVLGLAQFRASDRRLRALGEKMTESTFSRSSRLYLWRKKHFPNVSVSEALEVPCKRDVLEGAMLPMNPTDMQIVDTILLQTRCEVLFVGAVMQKTKDVELLNAGHEIIQSSGEDVSALLLLKKELGR